MKKYIEPIIELLWFDDAVETEDILSGTQNYKYSTDALNDIMSAEGFGTTKTINMESINVTN